MTIEIDLINKKFLKKAKYQKRITRKIIQCLTCERSCKLSGGSLGYCHTRYNHNGCIYTIVFGCNAGMSNNPIEKKPFYHFFPGSRALTIGTFGCNFDCFWCQNHHMSHPERNILEIMKNFNRFISPIQFVNLALKEGCQGTSVSFNEPTLLFEYSLEVFKLAKQKNLYNTYVSNGYMTKNVLKDLIDAGLDAMNIDIKGEAEMVQKYCGVNVENVWRNAKLAKELGVHIEITTLLISKLNTDNTTIRYISKRIINELGDDTPFHLSRFFPHYKSVNHGLTAQTPLNYLINAYKIAKNEGLNFVYLGNMPNTDYDKTYCPNCSQLVIERKLFGVKKLNLDLNGNCKYCGFPISII
ncbi:MAG: AmmeMemoRadiSam system radical SAM enzyme [Candidatus Thorarchaeota archaeon]